jgi:hypothetical protein
MPERRQQIGDRRLGTVTASSLSALALCCMGFSACGGASAVSGTRSDSTASAAPRAPLAARVVSNRSPHSRQGRSDNDGDGDNGKDDNGWGHAASPVDRQAVVGLLKRYYAVATAGDAAAGCALIYSLLAEEVPELYGEPPGPPSLRGSTCEEVVSKLFRQKHRQLVVDSATLEVIGVRVKRQDGKTLKVKRSVICAPRPAMNSKMVRGCRAGMTIIKTPAQSLTKNRLTFSPSPGPPQM